MILRPMRKFSFIWSKQENQKVGYGSNLQNYAISSSFKHQFIHTQLNLNLYMYFTKKYLLKEAQCAEPSQLIEGNINNYILYKAFYKLNLQTKHFDIKHYMKNYRGLY